MTEDTLYDILSFSFIFIQNLIIYFTTEQIVACLIAKALLIDYRFVGFY